MCSYRRGKAIKRRSYRFDIDSRGSGPLLSALRSAPARPQGNPQALAQAGNVVRITSEHAVSSCQTALAARVCTPPNSRAIQPAEPPPLLQLEASTRVTFYDGERSLVLLPHQGNPIPCLPPPVLGVHFEFVPACFSTVASFFWCGTAPCPALPETVNDRMRQGSRSRVQGCRWRRWWVTLCGPR